MRLGGRISRWKILYFFCQQLLNSNDFAALLKLVNPNKNREDKGKNLKISIIFLEQCPYLFADIFQNLKIAEVV